MNIQKLIKDASRKLQKNEINTYFLDSEILMSKVIGKDRAYLLFNSDKSLNKKDLKHFNDLIWQRSNGKPVAYLTGKKDFWKYEFDLSENVLIPRPESEIIVEQVIKSCQNKSKLKILDIGVGSGCLLLSVLKEKKDFYGTGIDINKKCIDISKKNSLKFNIVNRVKFFKTDIDNFNCGKYDLIISNPPYINKLDLKYLEKDIINFEPRSALDGGLDGISEIRKVINKSSELIKKNGHLILEIGFDQKNKVKRILQNRGFYIKKIVKDLSKHDRCIVSVKI